MSKIALIVFVLFTVSFSADVVKPKVDVVKRAAKTDIRVVVVPETTKVVKCDTFLVVKYDTTKYTSTLKDTTKVVKFDSTKTSSKLDTLKVKK